MIIPYDPILTTLFLQKKSDQQLTFPNYFPPPKKHIPFLVVVDLPNPPAPAASRLDAPAPAQLQAAGFGQLLPGPHAGAHDQKRGAQDLLRKERFCRKKKREKWEKTRSELLNMWVFMILNGVNWVNYWTCGMFNMFNGRERYKSWGFRDDKQPFCRDVVRISLG